MKTKHLLFLPLMAILLTTCNTSDLERRIKELEDQQGGNLVELKFKTAGIEDNSAARVMEDDWMPNVLEIEINGTVVRRKITFTDANEISTDAKIYVQNGQNALNRFELLNTNDVPLYECPNTINFSATTGTTLNLTVPIQKYDENKPKNTFEVTINVGTLEGDYGVFTQEQFNFIKSLEFTDISLSLWISRGVELAGWECKATELINKYYAPGDFGQKFSITDECTINGAVLPDFNAFTSAEVKDAILEQLNCQE